MPSGRARPGRSYWNWDPKEVWTFVIWVVYAAYLHARATSGVARQVVSYIALAGYACIIINFAVVNVVLRRPALLLGVVDSHGPLHRARAC